MRRPARSSASPLRLRRGAWSPRRSRRARRDAAGGGRSGPPGRARARCGAGWPAGGGARPCDVQASIPQTGDAESLNVAMAGTVALYELRGDPDPQSAPEAAGPLSRAWTRVFAEPVALSSTSSDWPSASGLPPLRTALRSRSRPTRAPCSAQGRTYWSRRRRFKRPPFTILSQFARRSFSPPIQTCPRGRRKGGGRTSRSTPRPRSPLPRPASPLARREPPSAIVVLLSSSRTTA